DPEADGRAARRPQGHGLAEGAGAVLAEPPGRLLPLGRGMVSAVRLPDAADRGPDPQRALRLQEGCLRLRPSGLHHALAVVPGPAAERGVPGGRLRPDLGRLAVAGLAGPS